MRKILKTAIVNALIIIALYSCTDSAKDNRITVAQDGSGDFTTVQEAINSVTDSTTKTEIFIKTGVYKEKVVVPEGKNLIHFLGEDKEETIITWDDHAGLEGIGTFNSYTFQINGNDIKVENLTIENSEGLSSQAVALHVLGDRCIFVNCKIIGNQDTLYAAGDESNQYYKDCYIDGTTDFIFGSATAVFENCHIHCKKNSYITAARTPENKKFGYVFLDCKITAEEGVDRVYLGRPWRDFANVVFKNCELGDHIRPEGWHNWGQPEREKTAFYAEYNNSGPGSDSSERVEWSHQLSDEKAALYTAENILNYSEWAFQP